MKRVLLVLLGCGLISSLASAQTKEDRAKAVKYLKETQAKVLEATKGLSEAQWNFKPAPDRWSVAEVAEHIAAAEDFLKGMTKEKVMTAPARPAGEDVAAIDAFVLQAISDRTQKAQAPEPLKPSNRFGSPQGSLEHFVASRNDTIAMVEREQGLRDHAVDSFLGKKLDAYEYLLFNTTTVSPS